MPQNYQRYFIVLTEESSEYTIAGKRALGKCILESKNGTGKIHFSVQNIKPGAVSGAYIAACNGNESVAVEIGRIVADSRGRAEVKLECNENNVLDSGFALKDFNIAAMLTFKNELMHTYLLGYKDGAVMWKNNLKIHSGKKSNNTEYPPDSPTAPTLAKAEAIEPDTKTEPEACPEIAPTLQNNTSDKKVLSENINLLKPCESPPPALEPAAEDFFETLEEGPAEKTFKDMAKKINEKLGEVDDVCPQPEAVNNIVKLSKAAKNDVDMIFRGCSKIRPFKNQDSKLEWLRISPSELSYLPDDFKPLCKDYFVGIAYRKYGHLILGREEYDTHTSITFGAPDIYTGINGQTAKLSGMSDFKCCDCGELIEGKHGYWLKSVNYSFED